MRLQSRLSNHYWILSLLVAWGLTLWVDGRHRQRLEHIAVLTRGETVVSAHTPTGYAHSLRERVLPDREGRGQEWIAQTQRMLAENSWRLRRIESENAPYGRESHVASPYRWWLGAVAGLDHWLTGIPLGLAVERTVLHADPLLHLLILAGMGAFVARHFGNWPATLTSLGGSLVFPFTAGFLPGSPDDASLSLALALASVLPLLPGLIPAGPSATATARPETLAARGFSLAGLAGGLGLWISPATQTPLLLGIGLGALLLAWTRRSAGPGGNIWFTPWRLWSLCGGITTLIAYLLEFFPDHLAGWEIRAVHPLYGLAWIGGGELLARATAWIQGEPVSWKSREMTIKLLALVAFLALPIFILWSGNPGFLAADPLFFRLTRQPDGIVAISLKAWINQAGFGPLVWTTLLPLLLLGPAVWLTVRRQANAAVTLLLGPLLLLLLLACFQLRWWMLLDALLLALLAAMTSLPSANQGLRRLGWAGAAGVLFLPGIFQVLPSSHSLANNVLSPPEAVSVIERDLAHWLAQHGKKRDQVLVLAPPGLTTSLNYYGNLKGLGTLSWENQEGLLFAIRTVISTSRDESILLLRQRGVTHIVIPSWDNFYDQYLQSASVQLGELFYRSLNRWALPAWLRPVPYQLPVLPGVEKLSVRIFEIVDDQEAPTAASRLTEYFIEQREWDNATASHQTLLKYPADFSALVARAQLWAALRDAEKFTPVFEPLLQRLQSGADRYLPWDRRVSLAVVLSQGNRPDLARIQVQRCLVELTEDRLRYLTTDSLYHLLVLGQNMGLEIADPRLRALALELLPPGLRQL